MAHPLKMTKAAEIEMIKKLGNSESYFNMAFTPEDLNQMVSNIENDFPLLFQTQYDKAVIDRDVKINILKIEVEKLKGMLEGSEAMVKGYKADFDNCQNELNTMKANRIGMLRILLQENPNSEALNFYSTVEIMSIKVELGIRLNEDEIKLFNKALNLSLL